jgi:long-chain acyl-CoA synthetase
MVSSETNSRTPSPLSELPAEPLALPLEQAYYWEKVRPAKIFLTQPIKGKARNWSWAEAMLEARRVAAYLKAQNWEPGSRIVILSRNCSWWIMADLAIWMAGHVTVPVYSSLTSEAAHRLISHCDAVACFIGALDNPDLSVSAIPDGTTCISFPNAPMRDAIDWTTIIAEHEPLPGNPVRQPNEMATIIYTSGTTGTPKGAMHRFGAFPYFAKAVTQVVGETSPQRVLSYLPLAHIAERALTEATAIHQGWRIFFCDRTATFLTDLKRARPTLFFSVPRLYARFQQGVLEKIPQRKLDRLLRWPILRSFIKRKILGKLGLSTVRFAASGSAALAPDLLLWFRKIGLPISEGYGTTECGITHTAPKGESRPGYVGRNAPDVETKIAENGEVLIKGPMTMLGYYKDPEATREAFAEDGFVRTGDLGELDENSWLKITGRIKEQFKTSKGKYVTPSGIELMLAAHPALESCLVMGDGLPSPFAVAVLSSAARQQAENETGRNQLERSLEQLLDATNSKLAPHEHLRFLVLVHNKWTIESGFVTPTLKLKRALLEHYYAPFIAEWLASGARLIWHQSPYDHKSP